jgi:2'-5' RNA ligase
LEGNLDALNRLQKTVEKAVESLGFLPEARGFTAHLTLGYVKDAGIEEKKRLGQALKGYAGNLSFGTYIFSEGVMMRSVQTPGGVIYTPLQYFQFGGK